MTLNELIAAATKARDDSPLHGDAPVALWDLFPRGKATAVEGVTVAAFGPHRWVVLDEGKPIDPMAAG